MKILILGGREFIGRTVVEAFVATGDEVSVLNRGSQPAAAGTQQLVADRYNAEQLRQVLTQSFDCIVDISGVDPKMIRNLLAVPAIQECPQYIYLSSASIYDRLRSQLPFHEDGYGGGDSIWDEYGVLKWQCEEELRSQYKGRLFVFRPPYVYGPYNNSRREQFVWALAGQHVPVPIPGDGRRRLQFCFSRDLADCVVRTARTTDVSEGIYNIAGDEILTQREWVALAAQAAHMPITVRSVFKAGAKARDYFPFRDADFYLECAKIKDALGFVATPLAQGLYETFTWFTERRPEELAMLPQER